MGSGSGSGSGSVAAWSQWKLEMSHAQELRLCQLVRARRCLYDARHPKFKDTAYRDRAWADIGAQLKLSGEVCKNRWRNIRDTYWRDKRLSRSKNYPKRRKWFLHDYVVFLETVGHKRRRSSAASPSQSEEDTDSALSNLVADSVDNTEVESLYLPKPELTEAESATDELETSLAVGEVPHHSELTTCVPVGEVLPHSELANCVPVGEVSPHSELANCVPVGEVSPHSELANCVPVGEVPPSPPSAANSLELLHASQEDRKPVLVDSGEAPPQRAESEKAPLQRTEGCLGGHWGEDDVDLFLRSMAITMRTFRPTILAETKKRICNLVMDMQIENEKLQTVSRQVEFGRH